MCIRDSLYLEAGRPLEAARELERGGDLPGAAAAFAKAGQGKTAAELIARDLEGKADWAGAADAWAGAEKWEKAAPLYEKTGQIAEAARAFREAGKVERAAALFVKAGELPEAAAAYEAIGKSELAAGIYRELQDWERAITLYRAAGKFADAALVLQERGRFDEAVSLFLRAGRGLEASGKSAAPDCSVAGLRSGETVMAPLRQLDRIGGSFGSPAICPDDRPHLIEPIHQVGGHPQRHPTSAHRIVLRTSFPALPQRCHSHRDHPACRQHDRRRPQDQCHDGGCTDGSDQRRPPGDQNTNLLVDRIVEVGDDGAQQVAAMAAAESGRREGNQAAVHLHATVGQGVEGGIVGHDSFAVVQHGPGDAEGPHADDRHQQGEHHGLGGGLNDQPTRRRRQRHTGRHRQTCLLYTSPSPRDRTRSRMPSSA